MIIPLYELEWPFGTQGALIIPVNTTTSLNAGSIRDYSRIEIFGTLRINSGNGLTMIGCASDFIVHPTGKIEANRNTSIGNQTGTVFLPDGYGRIPSTTIGSFGNSQRLGGSGGTSGSGRSGGTQNSGNGGGGAGIGANGENAQGSRGGHGGGNPNSGAPITSNNGLDGPSWNRPGGGGGSRGRHGSNLFIKVKGSFVNNGNILLNGSKGGNGGKTANR